MTVLQVCLGALAAVAAAAVLARTAMILATVRGYSMSPTLEPGDRVIVLRSWLSRGPRRGDIVLADLPDRSPTGRGRRALVVKRVAGVAGDRVVFAGQMHVLDEGQLFIVGDNADASNDSRRFGAISTHDIAGRVLSRAHARSGPARAAAGAH